MVSSWHKAPVEFVRSTTEPRTVSIASDVSTGIKSRRAMRESRPKYCDSHLACQQLGVLVAHSEETPASCGKLALVSEEGHLQSNETLLKRHCRSEERRVGKE